MSTKCSTPAKKRPCRWARADSVNDDTLTFWLCYRQQSRMLWINEHIPLQWKRPFGFRCFWYDGMEMGKGERRRRLLFRSCDLLCCRLELSHTPFAYVQYFAPLRIKLTISFCFEHVNVLVDSVSQVSNSLQSGLNQC
jgi:hypothetical protein